MKEMMLSAAELFKEAILFKAIKPLFQRFIPLGKIRTGFFLFSGNEIPKTGVLLKAKSLPNYGNHYITYEEFCRYE